MVSVFGWPDRAFFYWRGQSPPPPPPSKGRTSPLFLFSLKSLFVVGPSEKSLKKALWPDPNTLGCCERWKKAEILRAADQSFLSFSQLEQSTLAEGLATRYGLSYTILTLALCDRINTRTNVRYQNSPSTNE